MIPMKEKQAIVRVASETYLKTVSANNKVITHLKDNPNFK